MLKTFRAKMFLELGITLLLILILGGALLYLRYDLQKLSGEVHDIRLSVLSKAQSIETLTKLQTDSKQATQYFYILNNALPTSRNIIDFVKRVRELCPNLDGCNAIDFEPIEQAPQDGKPGSVVFDLNLTGSFDALVKFLTDLEHERYFTSINNFDISNPGPGKFRGVGSGEVYFRQ